mgnify:CR=1 FL=1
MLFRSAPLQRATPRISQIMSSHSVAESCGDVTQLDLGVDSVAPVRQSSAMDPTPESIAREYFARIRARNLDVSKLFCEDAVLLGLGDRVRGRQALRDFYGAAIRDARPTPPSATPAGGASRSSTSPRPSTTTCRCRKGFQPSVTRRRASTLRTWWPGSTRTAAR